MSTTATNYTSSNPKSTKIEKWYLTEYEFEPIKSKLSKLQSDYTKSAIDKRNDITRRQAEDEFWNRVAEYYGFSIDFKREKL